MVPFVCHDSLALCLDGWRQRRRQPAGYHMMTAPLALADPHRSPGAKLRAVVISGCGSAGVTVYRAGQAALMATGGRAYPPNDPAVLERCTLRDNSGRGAGGPGGGVGMHLEAGVAAALRGCQLRGPADTQAGRGEESEDEPPGLPLVVARAGSNLEVADSRLTGSKASAIVFAGARLVLRRTEFSNNKGSGVFAQAQAAPAAASAYESPARAALTSVYVSACRFENNTVETGSGGALFVGRGAVVSINNTVFLGNTAETGAGLEDEEQKRV